MQTLSTHVVQLFLTAVENVRESLGIGKKTLAAVDNVFH